MIKILISIFKTLVISTLALVAGNLLVVGDKTLSGHVAGALRFLELKPMEVAKGVEVLKDIPDGAASAAGTLKRAWDGVPKSMNIPSPAGNGAVANRNPHNEDHPPAAQRDLKKMIENLQEANRERQEGLKKALE